MRKAAVMSVVAAWAGMAAADLPPAETAVIGGAKVTVYTMNFLTAEEVAALKLVLVNEAALQLFVPKGSAGFAAMAVSPEDGFIRDGGLVPSATAIAGVASAEEAAAAALAGCNGAKAGKAGCVVVLEVAPE
jgi:hypothetical protein